jgi:hypothetical protein
VTDVRRETDDDCTCGLSEATNRFSEAALEALELLQELRYFENAGAEVAEKQHRRDASVS